MNTSRRAKSQKTRRAKSQPSPERPSRKYRENTGTKEAASAPSFVIFRTKLGTSRAKTKESAAAEVPSRKAMRWSRKYPSIRLIAVTAAMTEADLRRCRLLVKSGRLRC